MSRILSWLGKAFSDGGSPSSSRLLALLHSLVACGTLIYVVVKTHTMPDGTVLAGLGTFSVAPYAINRATTAWGKSGNNTPKPDVNYGQI